MDSWRQRTGKTAAAAIPPVLAALGVVLVTFIVDSACYPASPTRPSRWKTDPRGGVAEPRLW